MRLFNTSRINNNANNNNNFNVPPMNMSFYKKNLTRITQSNTVIVSAVKPEAVAGTGAGPDAAAAAGSKSRWGHRSGFYSILWPIKSSPKNLVGSRWNCSISSNRFVSICLARAVPNTPGNICSESIMRRSSRKRI